MGAGGDHVGSAYVDIDVNASPAEAALAALEAKTDRTFAEIGRKKAEATLDVKTTEFDAKIDKAKGELDDLESKKARVSVSLKGDVEKEIAEVKAEIKQLDRERATIKIDSKQVRAANKEQRLMSDARALDERRALDQAKAERALTSERQRSTTETIRNRAQLAKLSSDYEKLAGKQRTLQKSSAGIFSSKSIGTAENEARKLERVGSEMDLVKHKIESLGGSVDGLDPSVRRNSSLLDRWISRLGDTTIRIGPLTTSLKGLGVGLGLLGPLVFDLGGGLVSLAGFLGAGIAGAAAVGGGALAGFGLSAIGVGAIIKPLASEFIMAAKATSKLSEAQIKYGKGSTQAKTAQEQLSHTMAGVDPAVRKSAESYGNLKTSWKELTSAAKPAVFGAFSQSMKTAQALLPGFARESTKTTQVAAKAWDGWMKSLRSSEAKGLLNGIMGDFRQSIPGLASGLASLGAMLGRIGAAGAHFLPGLSHGFADWANNLEKSVGGGQKLTGEIGGMVNKMRDFGHLSQDTGSFLVHFFGASASAGDGLSNSLDRVMKKWNRWSQTAEGKASLKNFFSESKGATEDFMSSLGHFTQLLFEFSRATAPVANGLLKIVTFIGDLVSAADQIVGVKSVFQGLGVVLAGLFVAARAKAWATTIGEGAAALDGLAQRMGATVGGWLGMTAATEADTAALAANAAAAEADAGAQLSLAGASGEAGAAMGAEGLAADAGAAEGAMAGATQGAGLFAAAMAPEVLIPAAAIAALALFIGNTGKATTAFEEAHAAFMETEDMSKSIHKITAAGEHYNESIHEQISATKEVSDAKQHYLKLVNNGAPERKIIAALSNLNRAERQQANNARNLGVERAKNVKTDERALHTAEKRVSAAKAEERAARKTETGLDNKGNVINKHESSTWERDLAKAQRERAAAQREVAQTATALVAATVPLERQAKGLKPITEQAAQGLQHLAKTAGAQAAKKIGSFVDPKDVERATALSNRLTKLGQGSTVKKIAVKSSGADETLGKLQRLQKQTSRVTTARLNVKTNSEGASQKLSKLSSLSQKVSGANPTIHILANADNAEQAIQHLSSHLRAVAQKKYQARIDAIDQTTAPGSAARAKLTAIAQKKYQARLTAIDNASHPAAAAKAALDKVGATHPHPSITVNAAQALSSTQMVIGQLSALNGYTAHANVYVGLSGPGAGKIGHYSGGPSMYMPSFAVGGPSDAMLERAAEKAVLVPAGQSRKVNKPTMLTGEEPGHPEYVIATNPAYRTANERYLESAAGDLGKEVVPAYKHGGHHGGGSHAGGGSGGPKGETDQEKRDKTLAHHPPTPKHRSHKIAKVEKWGPVAAYNAAETDAGIKEELYSNLFSHDESEIKAGRMDNWEFARLKGLLSDQVSDYHKLGNLVPDIKQAIDKELGSIHGLVDNEGEFSKKSLRGLTRSISKEKAKLSKLKKGKNESDSSFRKRKLPFEQSITSMETEQHKKEKERQRLLEIRQEAKTELSEVSGAKKMNEVKTNAARSEDELQYVNDVESGAVESPYAENEKDEELVEESEAFKRAKADLVSAELRGDIPGAEAARAHMIEIAEGEYTAAQATPSPEDDIDVGERLKQLREPGGGGSGGLPPTIGEQTASMNAARETLYQTFASNITGPAGQLVSSMLSGAAPGYGPRAYATPGVGGAMAGATDGDHAAAGTINNVTNNFAAPPPDPHTFTKNLVFELNA